MPGQILIVDDEVHIRMLWEQTLEDLDEKNRALEVLMRQYKFPHTPVDAARKIWVARLDIDRMTGKSNPPPEG